MSKNILAASALALIPQLVAGPASAQTIVEALPDHVQRRIDADQVNDSIQKLIDAGAIGQGVVSGAKRWPVTDPVRVCFFGGTVSLRTKIMTIANQWTTGSPLKFDWGNAANPRLCNSEFSHIRVGFSPTGYWSLIGQDSVVYAGQLEQSLNLGMYDLSPPPEPSFTSTVLHEFGHALGFQHEHQHPQSTCEGEFNWPAIYNYLASAPNYWNAQKVDYNMRRRQYLHGDVTTGFDKNSIMLYSFPAQFYKQGTTSSCYTAGNTMLSTGDRQTFAMIYNRETQLAAVENAAKTLSPALRALVSDRVSLLRLDNTIKGEVVSRVELDQDTPTFGAAIMQVMTAPD